jgi:hypothetical protein
MPGLLSGRLSVSSTVTYDILARPVTGSNGMFDTGGRAIFSQVSPHSSGDRAKVS